MVHFLYLILPDNLTEAGQKKTPQGKCQHLLTRTIETTHDVRRDHGKCLAVFLETFLHAGHKVLFDVLEQLR